MGLFNKKTVKETTVVVARKTFNDRLTDVKSMFKKAYEEANNLRDEMLGEIAVKQTQSIIQSFYLPLQKIKFLL